MRLFTVIVFVCAIILGHSREDCNETNCRLPDCSCFSTTSPIDTARTPQIVVITFDDAVNHQNYPVYQEISKYKNANGCPISMTFYVSHKYTDYSLAHQLHRQGHEIAAHSVTHKMDIFDYWVPASKELWESEIMDSKRMMVKYGLVPEEDIKGFRAPFLVVGGDEMYGALKDSNFTYDCSWPTQFYTNWFKPSSDTDPLGGAFPFTLDYGSPLENPPLGKKPSVSQSGFWIAPMLDLEDGTGRACSMLDGCSGPQFNCTEQECEDGVYQFLKDNFDGNYYASRVPFGVYAHEYWFHEDVGQTHRNGYFRFLDYISTLPDVWMVSMDRLIQWMENPTSSEDIDTFEPFQCPPPDTDQCIDTVTCVYKVDQETIYLTICGNICPTNYPWLGNPDGN